MRLRDYVLQRRDVAHIACAPPDGRVAKGGQALCECCGLSLGHIDKGHVRTLLCKSLDHGRADAGRATRDENALAAQAGKGGKCRRVVHIQVLSKGEERPVSAWEGAIAGSL